MFEYNDDLLLTKLDEYIDSIKTSNNAKDIDDQEILNNVFKHLDIDNTIAVLLRGSRANHRNSPKSDVDVVAIVKKRDKDSMHFYDENNIYYHLNIFDRSILNINHDSHICRFYYGMKKLYDKEGIADKLIEDIKDYEIYNCNIIEKQNPEGKAYLYELLEYVDDEDKILADYVKAKILRESPAFLANYNGFNLIGFKTIIDCLIRDNYDLALIYGKALDKSSGKEEIKEWLDAAFSGLCGLNVLNLDFSSSKKSYEVFINGTSIYDLYNDYFMLPEYIYKLKPKEISQYDFYVECSKKAPKLFNKLSSMIKRKKTH